jgi:hypothetical protein
MKNNRVFPILALLLVASFSITACSPKEAPGQPALPPAEQPAEQPTENPFNPAALGECYNPFNPVMEGKVWKYAMVSGDVTSTLDISYKDVTASSFTSVQQFPDISTEVRWTCGPDGLLSSQFANMSITQVPDLKFETLEVKGVLIPTEDKWQVGYSWNTEYVIKVSFSSGDTAFEGQGNMTMASTISAIEPLTVPSGSYNDAYKVDVSGNMVMNIMGTESTLPLTFTNWYIKNVGMVKSSSADPTLTYTMELASLE